MTTKGKLNPKDIQDKLYEEKAQLKNIEEKIYQTMEVSSLMTLITQQKERIEELKEIVLRVEKEQKEDKENYLLASRKLEKDLQGKINDHETMARILQATKNEYEEKIQTIIFQKDEEIDHLKSEISSTKYELNKRISELNQELLSIKDFKERQDDYNREMDNLKKKLDDLIHTHNDDLKRIDNKNSKAIQMQQDKHEKEINEIMHNARKQAEQEVGKLEKQVIEDNKKLRLELIEYKKELEILKREKERAIGENKQIKQSVSIQEDGAIEYQAILYRQENKIKKLKEKVQVLKNYIAQEVTKYTKEFESAKYQYQGKVSDLETQLQIIRDEFKLKVKETKNLKMLSQMILDQRSEIEEFLIETLDHVKDEIRKQRTQEKRSTRLPEISSKSKLDSKPKKNWEKLDFTSLDWEDKEKIIRILFSKMNSGLLPSNWRTMSLERSSDIINNSTQGHNDSHKLLIEPHKSPFFREEIKGL